MKWLNYFVAGICIVLILYFLNVYLSSYFGWCGYEKYKIRVASRTVSEAKHRGTFVKLLHYKFVNYDSSHFHFEVFLERGFRFGLTNSDETRFINSSKYPFQMSYNSTPLSHVTLILNKEQCAKFDSCGGRGYLARPVLNDTVVIDILDVKNAESYIKVW